MGYLANLQKNEASEPNLPLSTLSLVQPARVRF